MEARTRTPYVGYMTDTTCPSADPESGIPNSGHGATTRENPEWDE